jgi:hypothetical protein
MVLVLAADVEQRASATNFNMLAHRFDASLWLKHRWLPGEGGARTDGYVQYYPLE